MTTQGIPVFAEERQSGTIGVFACTSKAGDTSNWSGLNNLHNQTSCKHSLG